MKKYTTEKTYEELIQEQARDYIARKKNATRYARIVEWLYLNDGAYDTKEEWRKAFLVKLREVLGDE